MTCADARTGEAVWRHRLGSVFFASPVAGDGKVYLVSETGETFRLVRSRARGWKLAAVARPVQSGRVAGVGSTHDVEREQEPGLAHAARGARQLVAHRLGDRVIVTSQIGSTPMTGGGHPQLARDERALAERETPIGGRRPETDRAGSDRDAPRSGSSSRRSGDRMANGCGSTRPARPGRSPIFTRSTTWRRRHRRPTASACTPGLATARSWRST